QVERETASQWPAGRIVRGYFVGPQSCVFACRNASTVRIDPVARLTRGRRLRSCRDEPHSHVLAEGTATAKVGCGASDSDRSNRAICRAYATAACGIHLWP